MSYHFSKTVDMPIDRADAATREALQKNGFGVLTEIDVQQTMKKKLDVDLYPYRILGACNPKMAYQALQAEDKIGTMLPCNVILQERQPGRTEISAIDPIASMQAIENPKLGEIATTVQAMMKKVIDDIGS
ncbi:MAG: DUF302 domain-containing protein [Pseudolabrys sp.]|jgi:uncharacterized protein (DUF302 family)